MAQSAEAEGILMISSSCIPSLESKAKGKLCKAPSGTMTHLRAPGTSKTENSSLWRALSAVSCAEVHVPVTSNFNTLRTCCSSHVLEGSRVRLNFDFVITQT